MYCKQCGKQVNDTSHFCGGCGAQCFNQHNDIFTQATINPNTGQAQQFGADQNNTMALVGLILAFFFPTLGIIFSIIGLVRAKELGGKGRGMAIWGLIISIIHIAVTIIMTILLLTVFREWIEYLFDWAYRMQ